MISPDGTESLATFDGLSATSTLKGFENGAAKDHAKTGVHDEHGRLRQSIDHLCNTVTFHYTADGLPRQAVTNYHCHACRTHAPRASAFHSPVYIGVRRKAPPVVGLAR